MEVGSHCWSLLSSSNFKEDAVCLEGLLNPLSDCSKAKFQVVIYSWWYLYCCCCLLLLFVVVTVTVVVACLFVDVDVDAVVVVVCCCYCCCCCWWCLLLLLLMFIVAVVFVVWWCWCCCCCLLLLLLLLLMMIIFVTVIILLLFNCCKPCSLHMLRHIIFYVCVCSRKSFNWYGSSRRCCYLTTAEHGPEKRRKVSYKRSLPKVVTGQGKCEDHTYTCVGRGRAEI